MQESKVMEHHKQLIDLASLSTVIATLAGWLPALAALFSIIWSCIRIYETDTVQKWLGRKK
jgi:hypothetical protein